MGTGDSEGQTPSIKTKQTEESKDSQIVNLFDFKLKKMNDEELVNECLMYLRFVEMGLIMNEHKVRAKQLFLEAIKRPSLEFISNDFRVALKVINTIYPDSIETHV